MRPEHSKFAAVKSKLEKTGIATFSPGFCDDPAFLNAEKADPTFLDEYARYVHWQPYTAEYLARSESIIRIVAEEMRRGLVLENRLGGCIDTSMTMARILEKHGVWSYVVRGALRISFPSVAKKKDFCFWPVDIDDGSDREFGHKWLNAPPFDVVDVTLKLQEYEDNTASFLPDEVIAKGLETVKVSPQDILCPFALDDGKRKGMKPRQTLKHHVPKFVTSFGQDFPAYLYKQGQLRLKYVPVGIGGADGQLEQIRSFKVNGKFAYAFYESEIKPKLEAAGF